MRHGFAGKPSPDPTIERNRPLLPEGVAMVKAVANAMGASDEIPNVIFCSPLVRATMTADIVGKLLGVQVNVVGDLSPNRPLDEGILSLIGRRDEAIKRVMIVGHVDNTTPAMRAFGGDQKWKSLVMAECRRVNISRKDGSWKLKWCVAPSDLGLKDYDS